VADLYFADNDKRFLKRFREEAGKVFEKGDKVAIKLHMGEKENPNHLKPAFVKKVVDALISLGAKPFLFDSPVKYSSPRNTEEGYLKQCVELGFSESFLGCPVIISNSSIEVRGEHMKYGVCRHLAEADGVLVLTHFKGHVCTGVGGSLKNIGMGALSKDTKKAIHEGAEPVLSGECILCKKCSEVCPGDCITYSDNGPCFDYEKCYGCSKCIQVCPQKCLKPRVAEFDTLLVEGADAALSMFKKVYFVNVIRNVTNKCDCQRSGIKKVMCDMGILMGSDIVAIDKASVDMINQKSGKKLFDQIWHKDSELHIERAEGMGVGTRNYDIIKA